MVCNTILRPALGPLQDSFRHQQNNTQQNSTEEYDYTQPQIDYFAFERRNQHQHNTTQFNSLPSTEPQSHYHIPTLNHNDEDQEEIQPQRRTSIIDLAKMILRTIDRNGGIGNTGW